jgi:hypothetical protein
MRIALANKETMLLLKPTYICSKHKSFTRYSKISLLISLPPGHEDKLLSPSGVKAPGLPGIGSVGWGQLPVGV